MDITYSIFSMPYCIHTLCLSLFVRCPTCGMFLVSSLLTLSFLPFCSVILTAFVELCEMVIEFIYPVSCQCLVGFCHLILDIIFSRYIGDFYMSLQSGDCVACFGHIYSVIFTIVVIYPMSYYCSMHPRSIIFSLHCYS